MTLRTRLVLAVLALVTAGLASAGAAGVFALRDYLVDRTDDRLYKMATGLREDVAAGQPFDPEKMDQRIPRDVLFQIYETDGTMTESFPDDVTATQPSFSVLERSLGRPFTSGSWRVILLRVSGGRTLVVGQSLADVDAIVRRLGTADLIVGAVVLLILAAAGVVIVRQSLQPLVRIEETAEAIAAGRLSERVPDRDPRTEVGRLAAALNGMLTQIEVAFRLRAASEANMRRFVADAGHELRTPLTAIRGFAQFSRQSERDTAELTAVIGRIDGVAGRMSVLVDDLLLLARLDQPRPLERKVVDLFDLVADVVTETRVLAQDRELALEVRADAAYHVTGDPARLRQVIGNLLTNAVKHTPAGTPVTVVLSATGDSAVVEVADEGPGLSVEQAARVFERFYRADPARSRESGGSGLGLAIVAALVAVHGGTVSLRTAPGAGCTFRLELPLAA
jgi:two-component system OmpR family sensor kinase